MATDWPQFMGPSRNLTTPDEAPGWIAGGLRIKWRVPLAAAPYDAGCFGSLAVAQGRVLTLTTNGCEALDAHSGDVLWTSPTNSGIGHSTPAVCAGRVYVYDARAVLCCLDLTNGSVIWAQAVSNHVTGFRRFDNNSQSPLVADGRVFVFAAASTNCVLAFNATNGALVWKGHNYSLIHASPVLATFCGVPQLVCQTANPSRLVALAPEDGRLLWTQANSAIYTTPVPWRESLVSPEQSRGMLNVILTNDTWGVTQAWTSTEFGTTWTLPVVKDGYIYEICGPSYGIGELRCVRLTDGAVQWSTNGFGRGSVILAGTRLVVLAESGWLHVVNANPQGYQLLSRCQPITNSCFNLPAVADGRIYLRNDRACVCMDAPPPLVGELSRRNPANYALTIRATDDSVIDPARVPRIGVQIATALRTNSETWVPFNSPCFYTNGTLVYTNLPPPTRFFRVCETNAP
jgi:outer membrane protein assembly factor BamB